MKSRAQLINDIQSINANVFHNVAMDVFRYQYKNNKAYQEYVDNLILKENISSLSEPVFFPIQAFKHKRIVSGNWTEEQIFTSSGTTGNKVSKHYVRSTRLYLESCARGWKEQYGNISEYSYLCLLPGYMERPGSSLIEMMKYFVAESNYSSGFYLQNHKALYNALITNKKARIPTVLFGVSFGLIDFIEKYTLDFPELIIMETGGMKGRREEMLKEELHAKIAEAFNVKNIHSEYGMTELFSQAYSQGKGVFQASSTLKIDVMEITDPLTKQRNGKTGNIERQLRLYEIH